MPITASTEYSGTYRRSFLIISSATSDTGPITLTTGLGASAGISAASDSTNFMTVTIEPILAAGTLSQWCVTDHSATTIVVDRSSSVASSSSASNQVRITCQAIHSIMR